MSNYYCRFGLTSEYNPVKKFLWIPNLDPQGKAEEFYVKTIIYGVKTLPLIFEVVLGNTVLEKLLRIWINMAVHLKKMSLQSLKKKSS